MWRGSSVKTPGVAARDSFFLWPATSVCVEYGSSLVGFGLLCSDSCDSVDNGFFTPNGTHCTTIVAKRRGFETALPAIEAGTDTKQCRTTCMCMDVR